MSGYFWAGDIFVQALFSQLGPAAPTRVIGVAN
jgi:hypothetical protein